MNIPRLSVRRPITTIMVFSGVVILGAISLGRLKVGLLPPIAFPRLTVITAYENVAPKEIESLVTKPIEEAVGSVGGVERVTSESLEGLSLVNVEFTWGTDMDFAALEVRERVDLIKGALPQDVKKSIISKFDPSETPMMSLGVFSRGIDLMELRRLAERDIKRSLERIEGVASATVTGGLVREIAVDVDLGRLYAHGLSLDEIVHAIDLSNYNYPAGYIERGKMEYMIRTVGEFQSIRDIEGVVVGTDPEGTPIFLRNVADVKDAFKERTSISRFNGEESVAVAIHKEAGANTVEVSRSVAKALDKIREELKGRAEIVVVYDQATYIRDAIQSVMSAAIVGGVLAFLVLLAFLGEIRSPLIIATSIPISIMATFGLMFLMGITLNTMSLGGLALGVGMMVDCAIVVLENIARRREGGLSLAEATVEGSQEVASAVTASTLTTVAVFLPMIYVRGVAGVLFRELALTVTSSIMASLIVALSLVPVLNILPLRGREAPPRPLVELIRRRRYTWALESFSRKVKSIEEAYLRLLQWSLEHRVMVGCGVLLAFSASLLWLWRADREFMPRIDTGEFTVKIELPRGTRLEDTDSAVRNMESYLLGAKDVRDVSTTVGFDEEELSSGRGGERGTHTAYIIVRLVEGKRRPLSEIIDDIRSGFPSPEGVKVEYIAQESAVEGLLSEGGKPVVVEVSGSDLDELHRIGKDIAEGMRAIEGIEDVEQSSQEGAPEIEISIDRDRAAAFGLSIKSIATTLKTAIEGMVATQFREEDTETDIRVRLRPQDRRGAPDLGRILIESPLGVSVPLDKVARVLEGRSPTRILRYDQRRVEVVTANASGRRVGRILKEVEEEIAKYNAGKDYSVALSGESRAISSSFESLRFALILAVVLVYMILASQFESLIHPFIVILSVPLTAMGVALSLAISGKSLSVVVFIGMILLAGIVVNNAIVLIDRIKIGRERGLSPLEAAMESCRSRLRPILMTTLTTALGLTPLAVGLGRGSELQSPMAIAVIGGLLTSTVLTLILIPAAYLAVEERRTS
ncbi:MAG: efflux RND transporter permease subunit [bacterium]